MAIAFDVASNGAANAAATSISWSHNVGAGSNRILIVAFEYTFANSITSVTYNSVALTQLALKQGGASSTFGLAVYYLLMPATGNLSIVVTMGSSSQLAGCSSSYLGIAQSSTFGTIASNNGTTGAQPSNTVTTTSTSQWVIDTVQNGNGNILSVNASQNKRAEQTGAGESAIADIVASGGNMNLSWTGATGNWSEISVAMNAFVAAGGASSHNIVVVDPLAFGTLPGNSW